MISNITLIKLFEEMMVSEKVSSVNTRRAYLSDIKTFIGFLKSENEMSVLSVEKKHLTAWLSKLNDDNIARNTFLRKISSIKEFYKFLVVDDFIKINPTAYIKAPTKHKNLPNVLSVEEIEELIKAILPANNPKKIRLLALVEIMYSSGIRVEELVGLLMKAIDFDKNCMLVKGKGDKERMVPIGENAIKAIKKYLSIREFFLKNDSSSPWLFPSSSFKGYLTARRFAQLLKDVAIKAGLDHKKVSPHVLRHAFATHMLAGGADLRVLQEILGHSDISTVQIYTHIAGDKRREAIEMHPLAKNKIS